MGEGIGGLGRPYIKFELCPFANYSCFMGKGVFVLYFIFHQFRTNLLDMPNRIWRKISDFLIYCSVLEWGRGLVGWGGLISNLNSVRLRFTAASWKKGYSCYITFFTNFALIYWTCLIGFEGKSHRSCNLAHTVGDLD